MFYTSVASVAFATRGWRSTFLMRAYSTSVRSSCRTGLPTGEFEMPLPAAWRAVRPMGHQKLPFAPSTPSASNTFREHTRYPFTRPFRTTTLLFGLRRPFSRPAKLPIRLRRRRLSGTMFGAMTNGQVGLPDLVQVGAPRNIVMAYVHTYSGGNMR
ncbi:hypothetical protein BD309DRAFT_955953 [Dichomitus squalens]|nr:hypothetical protein BD309DRAFT_955953 [Dichomitus squalens]